MKYLRYLIFLCILTVVSCELFTDETPALNANQTEMGINGTGPIIIIVKDTGGGGTNGGRPPQPPSDGKDGQGD